MNKAEIIKSSCSGFQDTEELREMRKPIFWLNKGLILVLRDQTSSLWLGGCHL